ncbi:MAG: TRAP transporter large permease subunit [Desulfarculaceae bacterium]|nr:TRAP transporter large permease subunit [Desulfarculaceae bacterium]MCF8046689.1 TRAP transporter large permease subunit [Desulfarculaceae bacterium]MCF8066432.1 TRAP transporter large permease subunit [Desulfarculaceae bacterium]MCF8097523.1 TRAP transporter large permease subunit [Desulfarculaceae bacterium]MCF8121540.1 TRAP transporter large permease subunit [Desulfarculaceae bacterium]
METWLLTLIVFSSLVVLLAIGIPIAFAMLAIAAVGIILTWGPQGLLVLFNTAYAEGTSYLLLAVPLFIFMANILKFSGLADKLYEVVYRWMGGLRGGLAMGTVVICAIFAAMAGISSVATISMGLIALPSMLQRKYNKVMAVGCINAGGALGILIPPSILMILYGNMAEVSIGRLFAGGMLPGILLATIFVLYIGIRCFFQKDLGPAVTEKYNWRDKFRSLKGVVLPVSLVVLVLGVIYSGVATPTEAAGVGAGGAVVTALIHRQLTWARMWQALKDTLSLTVMVFWIIIGAVSFTTFLAYAGIQDMLQEAIMSMDINRWIILIAIQLVFFVLGMFLDPAGIILLTTPIFVPIINQLGFDPLWFGVLFIINMEMAYITPPFGFNLFILKSVVPPQITMADIYRSVGPFVILQAICLAMVMLWPEIATWLPSIMVTK